MKNKTFYVLCAVLGLTLAAIALLPTAMHVKLEHDFVINPKMVETKQLDPQIDQITIGEFAYDNCTYIYVRQQTDDHITHKGNCTNILHNQFSRKIEVKPTNDVHEQAILRKHGKQQ